MSLGNGSQIVERIVPGSAEWRQEIVPHAQRYRFAAKFVRGKRVLDAGCGTGYGSCMIADAGASEVVAVDISEEALEVARKEFARPNLRFVCDDCEALSRVQDQFDVILSLESLEHFHSADKFLEAVLGRLSPSGTFVCSTPNGNSSGKRPENPYHVHEYSAAEMQHLLGKHFSDISLYGQQWTATFRTLTLLWTNPLVRFGRWLQKLRGRRLLPWPYGLPPTEGDIIISDLSMPNMSGFEFLSVVRKRFPQIPVIAISGAYNGGFGGVIADAFFFKGQYSPEELFAKIRMLIEGGSIRPSVAKSDGAPLWIPINDSGYFVVTCTACLRSSSIEATDSPTELRELECPFCGSAIRIISDKRSKLPPRRTRTA